MDLRECIVIMRINENTLISNESMGADITSRAQALPHIFGYCVQAVWTGSPVGTMTLEASNDGVIWSTVDGSTEAISGAGDGIYHVTDVFYAYVRLKYTRTSGTGTLNVSINLKGV